MSDPFAKVRGVRELPLFPLPLVLFPGVPLPLHIFEERYRRLLADARASHNLFGLPYFDGAGAGDSRPAAGHVGCVAEIVDAQTLPDGRANILTVGLVRYRLESYADAGEPYLVGRVEFFADEAAEGESVAERAREVAGVFRRIAHAVRTLNDDRAPVPDLPEDDPERLSFLIAAAMEMDDEAKQAMLELRSTTERLARLGRLLAGVVEGYETRARAHGLARGNGHGGGKVKLDG